MSASKITWFPTMADVSFWSVSLIQSIRERCRSPWCVCREWSTALVETSSDDGEGVQLLLGILLTTRWKLARPGLIVWQPANRQLSPGRFQRHTQAFASRPLNNYATQNCAPKIACAQNRREGAYLHCLKGKPVTYWFHQQKNIAKFWEAAYSQALNRIQNQLRCYGQVQLQVKGSAFQKGAAVDGVWEADLDS